MGEAVSDTQHNTCEILKYCDMSRQWLSKRIFKVVDECNNPAVERTRTRLLGFQYTQYKCNCRKRYPWQRAIKSTAMDESIYSTVGRGDLYAVGRKIARLDFQPPATAKL
jgi:hypothetical protein